MGLLQRLKFLFTGNLYPVVAIERLEVKSGDTVIMNCDRMLSDESVAHIRDVATRAFPPGVKCLVLPEGIRVGGVLADGHGSGGPRT